MREIYDFTLEEESVEEMYFACRFVPALKITFRVSGLKYTHTILADIRDDVLVFQDKAEVFVLSRNASLEYVGLEVFSKDERVGGVYLQGAELRIVLGNRDLAPKTIIRRLRSIFF